MADDLLGVGVVEGEFTIVATQGQVPFGPFGMAADKDRLEGEVLAVGIDGEGLVDACARIAVPTCSRIEVDPVIVAVPQGVVEEERWDIGR